jgi:hypothetical protein
MNSSVPASAARLACVVAALSACVTDSSFARTVVPEARQAIPTATTRYGDVLPSNPAWESEVYAKRFFDTLPPEIASRCEHSTSLDSVAAAMAGTSVGADNPPALQLTRWFLWRAGVVSPFTRAQATPITDLKPHIGWLLKGFGERLKERDLPCSFGVVVQRLSAASVTFELLVVHSPVVFDPFPKEWHAGETLKLHGRALTPLVAPRIFVDADAGVRVRPVTIASDGTFTVDVPLPSHPGRAFVSMVARETGCAQPEACWSPPIAEFPLWLDTPVPDEPGDLVDAVPNQEPEQSAWPQKILEAFNAERAAANLAPLKLEPEISKAAAEAAEVAKKDKHAPLAPSLVERFASAGLPVSGKVWQDHMRAEYLSDYLALMSRSPERRWIVLDPAAAYLGVGVADAPGGQTQVVAYIAGTGASAQTPTPAIPPAPAPATNPAPPTSPPLVPPAPSEAAPVSAPPLVRLTPPPPPPAPPIAAPLAPVDPGPSPVPPPVPAPANTPSPPQAPAEPPPPPAPPTPSSP